MDGDKKSLSSDIKTVVGILSSAGGLESASQLVRNLPLDAGTVYVLAQHMSPTHKSMLAVLLARETKLSVVELTGETVPVPNTVYIPPPNSDVVLENGRIGLRDPSQMPGAPKPSGDRLFDSLARDLGERSVAIVLSGTGTDGNYGIKAIREAGGVTIAQELGTAKYDGMPGSAIETGCIDLILSPEEIGLNLEKILANPRDLESLLKPEDHPSGLTDLFQILKARCGIDFREYKESTVNRRVARRMVANDISDYENYVDFCRKSVIEVDSLGQDLLISVTRFFRDAAQFKQFRATIKELVESRKHEQLRVWIAGCATGEEAYSIAILFGEALGGIQNLKKTKIQIFATDVDDRALENARRGVYPITAIDDIHSELLEPYFNVYDTQLEVKQEVRNVVLFSHHNLATDPPFINVDLVSLRNVLIYFKASLQERVFSRIDYALDPGGVLFLGTSETALSNNVNFEVRKNAEKIYYKRATGQRRPSLLSLETLDLESNAFTKRQKSVRSNILSKSPKDHKFDALARSVAPNGFMANSTQDIVRIFGQISDVLELSESVALGLTTKILRGGMRNEAASMITTTLKSSKARTGNWYSFDSSTDNEFRLRCYPIAGDEMSEDTVLFAVETRAHKSIVASAEDLSNTDRSEYIRSMESQMQALRETLNQTIEELQNANEDMQAINEEFQSTNEELQATNEEFETSNEELQSTNEELITVNDEMHANTTELQKVSTELSAVVHHSPYPMLIIDPALLIRRTSQRALEFFNISSPPKTGLHVSQCALPSGFPSLAETCIEVMKSGEMATSNIEIGDILYTVQVTPFKDIDDLILGLKLSVMEFNTSVLSRVADLMGEMGGLSYWRLNIEDNSLHWSKEVFRIHGLDPDGKPPSLDEAIDLYHPNDRERVATLVQRAISDKQPFSFSATIVRADGSEVPVQAVSHVVTDVAGAPAYVVGVFRVISKRVHQDVLLEQMEEVQQMRKVGFYSFDYDQDIVHLNSLMRGVAGLSQENGPLKIADLSGCFEKSDAATLVDLIDKAQQTGEGFEFKGKFDKPGYENVGCEGNGAVRRKLDGSVSHIYGTLNFLTEW